MALSADGRWLATFGQTGGGIYIRDTETGRTERRLLESTTVRSAAFSPNREWLIVETGDRLVFYTVGQWTESHATDWDNDAVPQRADIGMSFTADGGLLAVPRSAFQIKLVRPADGRVLATLPTEVVHAPAALDPTGTRFACCGADNCVQVWDLALVRRQLNELGLGVKGPK